MHAKLCHELLRIYKLNAFFRLTVTFILALTMCYEHNPVISTGTNYSVL